MKPITIVVDKNNKPLVTLEELKKMLKGAYDEGYSDGRKNNQPITIYPTYPSYPYQEPWWKKVYIGNSTTPLNYGNFSTDNKSTEGPLTGFSTSYTTTGSGYNKLSTDVCTTNGKSGYETDNIKTIIEAYTSEVLNK